LCGRELPPKRLRLNVVGADSLTVDLDDGDQLAVAPLELRFAVDRHLLELEAELAAKCVQGRRRALTQMTPIRLEENDARVTDKGPA
jgi:hypothetical protein